MIKSRFGRFALVCACAITLAACASTNDTYSNQRADANAVSDPLEPMNRVIFDVNDFLDRLLIRPLAELYRGMIPPPIRDRVAGILNNMGEPVIFANNVLQGDLDAAGTTLERFAVNTTAGVGGMFEVASELDLPRQHGDFGQTLHIWGAGSGPYLVLPLLGPSNARDAVGYGVDAVMSPWKYIVASVGDTTATDTYMIVSTATMALVRREQNIESMDAIRNGSIDFYAQMRSVYTQYRFKALGIKNQSQPVIFDYNEEYR